MSGQIVELLLRGEDNYSRPFYSPAPGDHTTNNDGVYRISGVPPGRYLVKVGVGLRPRLLWSQQKDAVYYPETFHPDAAEEVQGYGY